MTPQTHSSQNSTMKECLLKNICMIASQEKLSNTQTLELLTETTHCFGGSLDTTRVATELICYFLDILQNSLDQKFVVMIASKALTHMNVPDAQERFMIGCVLHRLYSTNPRYRNELRVLFGQFLDQGAEFAAGDILDIILLIVQGFTVPLRDTHLDFCRTYLIPLLNHAQLPTFFLNLKRCLTQYVLMTPLLNREIVSSLLQACRGVNESIYVQLLDFAMDLICTLTEEEYHMIQTALYQRMAMFIKTEHVQVALRPFEDGLCCSRILRENRVAEAFLLPALEHGILIHTDTSATTCVVVLQMVLQARSG